MALNIKNEETYALVKELAVLKGVSLTAAVTDAVEREIENEKARRKKNEQPPPRKRSEILQAFAQEFSRRVKDPIHSWEIDGLLYDENGLPK
jgi:hypothetical protein